MKINELFAVSPAKVEALKTKINRLGIDLALIDEQFTRGRGKGGQKLNKTSDVVVLRYAPLELNVKMGRERQRNINRFLALRELVEKIEMKLAPQSSERMQDWEKKKKQKNRRHRRHAKKLGE